MFQTRQVLRRSWLLALISLAAMRGSSAGDVTLGPLYQEFHLTLAPGHRQEALGPLYYDEQREEVRTFAVPPLFSWTEDTGTDSSEFDFLYPILTYDRFGQEKRWQFLQVLNFSGGKSNAGSDDHRLTLFPFYFQQRSSDPAKNYTAFIPFYGHLKNRLLRDEVKFVLIPLYLQSRKRDVVTDNYVYPFFHLRRGNGLNGWQFWPLVGREHKTVTTRTNIWDELETIPGHDKFFAAWPFFLRQDTGLGTDNPERHRAVLPLFTTLRSPRRDSSTYLWPFGLTLTEDREKKYHEWGLPWPIIVFTRGEGKTTSRLWPLFSQSHNDTVQSDFYLWPVYKFNRIRSEPLDRQRTRLLFFLYSDLSEKNTETGGEFRRRDAWPLFTARRDFAGHERWQILSILEPLLPNSKSIERNYSPLWSLWRAEKDTRSGATSQSALWNLYRRDTTLESKKYSLLFGLFQYQSGAAGKRWRLFYVPIGKMKTSGPPPHRPT